MRFRNAGGRAGEKCEQGIADANARYANYKARYEKLTVELGAKNLTDDAIDEMTRFAEDVRAGIDEATYEDKRRYMEMLRIKVPIKDGQVAEVTGVICFLHSRK
jgi:hypothetical protein